MFYCIPRLFLTNQLDRIIFVSFTIIFSILCTNLKFFLEFGDFILSERSNNQQLSKAKAYHGEREEISFFCMGAVLFFNVSSFSLASMCMCVSVCVLKGLSTILYILPWTTNSYGSANGWYVVCSLSLLQSFINVTPGVG